MELQWGFLLPDGEILEGSGMSEFPDHRFLASEYFAAQGDPDTGDPESAALTAGWIAFVIDSGEFRLKLSRLPGEDSAWPLNNAISAVERLRERYGVEPVMVTAHMFTAAGLARGESPDEPMRMTNPRRAKNAEYWTMGDSVTSWGFVHPDRRKLVDGMKMASVNSHDELAAKMTKVKSTHRAMTKLKMEGWIRYLVSNTDEGLDLAMQVYDLPGEDPEALIDRIMVALRLVTYHIDMDPAVIHVDTSTFYVRGDNISQVRRKLESSFQLA